MALNESRLKHLREEKKRKEKGKTNEGEEQPQKVIV
jgi:hypothetical protein